VIGLLAALFATALFVVLGLMQFRHQTSTYRPVVPPYDLFWCQTNDDCTVTDRIGCCACGEGGAQAAITRWRRDELASFLAGACQPMHQQVCVQIDLCHEDPEAECVDRRCRLVIDDD
jgi:hypothetical protein